MSAASNYTKPFTTTPLPVNGVGGAACVCLGLGGGEISQKFSGEKLAELAFFDFAPSLSYSRLIFSISATRAACDLRAILRTASASCVASPFFRARLSLSSQTVT